MRVFYAKVAVTNTHIFCKVKILFPEPLRMIELNYAKLSYCPFIIVDDGSYPSEVNQYLRERSLGEWVPHLGQSACKMEGKAIVQTKASREAMARRLVEFLRWCERSVPKKKWRAVDYEGDLLDEWQTGLLTGTLSTSGKELTNGTVNVLISEAVYFLTWAADRKYRAPFVVSLNAARVNRSSGRSTYNNEKTTTQTRMGGLTVKPSFTMLPTTQEIERWLHEVHYLRGPVKRLACETICRTGLRITECVELQVSDIPQKVDGVWPRASILAEGLAVNIHRGNKGRKVSTGSLESVTPRTVYLPLDLAERIHHYIHEVRSTLILRGIDRIHDKAERQSRLRAKKPTHLWIGETYGMPFSSGMLYKSWTNVPSLPNGWHPHVGREFFAVETMVQYAKDFCDARSVFQVHGVNQLGWLDSLMSNQIKVILSPVMGHVSDETTNIYLRKMKHRLVEIMGHPAIMWAEICTEEGDDFDKE